MKAHMIIGLLTSALTLSACGPSAEEQATKQRLAAVEQEIAEKNSALSELQGKVSSLEQQLKAERESDKLKFAAIVEQKAKGDLEGARSALVAFKQAFPRSPLSSDADALIADIDGRLEQARLARLEQERLENERRKREAQANAYWNSFKRATWTQISSGIVPSGAKSRFVIKAKITGIYNDLTSLAVQLTDTNYDSMKRRQSIERGVADEQLNRLYEARQWADFYLEENDSGWYHIKRIKELGNE